MNSDPQHSPTTPGPPSASLENSKDNLWSSILNSVSSSRSIPTGNILILGEPSSGKTTLVNGLLQKAPLPVGGTKTNETGSDPLSDFAIGYQWANVKDEGEEDTLARLSVYSVPSSSPSHLALLPRFLNPRTCLPRTLVMIALDWTKPWSFIEQLELWFKWIEAWIDHDGSREMQVLKEEGRERLQYHLQHYAEPTAAAANEPLPASLSSTLLPLGSGTFTHNSSGIPIIVTCTKADLIDEEEDLGIGMTQGKGTEWEERTDEVMQALRTICLKYGAALFYTTPQPNTLSVLRQYALHFLFTPPPSSPDSSLAAGPSKHIFPFSHRPNTLDRDRILVPAGWDSWGKIGVLRDGFDCEKWGEAWEQDLNARESDSTPGGAKDLFKALVEVEQGRQSAPLPSLITTEPDQSFLASHYEAQSKDPSRDPRASFRQPVAGTSSDGYYGSGVVGPMGASSLSLPSVERAMAELEGEDVGARLLRATGGVSSGGPGLAARRGDVRANAHPHSGHLTPIAVPAAFSSSRPTPPLGVSPSPNNNTSSPAGVGGVGAPGTGNADGKSQNEVLAQFFQSLLTNRGPSSSGGPNPNSAGSPGAGTETATLPAGGVAVTTNGAVTSVGGAPESPKTPAANGE